MKKILIAAALLFALPATAFAKDATCSIKYTGWHCSGCAGKVEAAVKKVDGVKKVKVTKDTITATYDDAKATPDAIKSAVASAGDFKVEETATK